MSNTTRNTKTPAQEAAAEKLQAAIVEARATLINSYKSSVKEEFAALSNNLEMLAYSSTAVLAGTSRLVVRSALAATDLTFVGTTTANAQLDQFVTWASAQISTSAAAEQVAVVHEPATIAGGMKKLEAEL
jgi:hypothetical protein